MIDRPGTMTNLFYKYVPGESCTVRAMRRLREVGFDVMDLWMCGMQRRDMEFCEDECWEKYVDEIGEEAARLGITFVQSHPPYPKGLVRRRDNTDEGCELNPYFRRMQERAIEIDCRLGIRWAVLHPVAVNDYDLDANAAYNYEIYAPIYEWASKKGVGFAFENMADLDSKRRFGITADELKCILAKFGNPADVGICWDMGHANRSLSDPVAALRAVGDRLVCTHIDDNIGQTDLHTLPYFGSVDWANIMKTLREINYQGAFIYELAVSKYHLPEPLLEPCVRYAYEVSKYLVSQI